MPGESVSRINSAGAAQAAFVIAVKYREGVGVMTNTELKIEALRTASKKSPEYAEIVPLFIQLYEYINGREQETGIGIELCGAKAVEGADKGFPLLSPVALRVQRERAVRFLMGVIAVLKEAGREGQDDLGRISEGLEHNRIDPVPLFSAVMERRRAPLDEAAAVAGVPASLLEYIVEIPLKIALEHFAEGYSADSFPDWEEGFCPVCGSRAGMAELAGEEGRRHLSCSACNFRWPIKRLKCPYCGNEETEKLAYFTADGGPTRVDTCSGCSRYIKTRDSRKGNADVPLEVEDLLTIHLDMLAAREGYERGK